MRSKIFLFDVFYFVLSFLIFRKNHIWMLCVFGVWIMCKIFIIYTVCYKVILKMIHRLIKYKIACRGKEVYQIGNIILSWYKICKDQNRKLIDYNIPCEIEKIFSRWKVVNWCFVISQRTIQVFDNWSTKN